MFSANTAQVSSDKLYVDDVFSTYLYTGNGSTQTINNGIDLAGKGGLVWIKNRSTPTNTGDHRLYDTSRGVNNALYSNTTDSQTTLNDSLTAFSSTGFTLGTSARVNESSVTWASWTFRKAPKFFDVVTFTAGSSTNRRISHSLGQIPGMIIVKKYSSTGSWDVYHKDLGRSALLNINTTSASSSVTNVWGTSDPTASDFGINETVLCTSGESYVAYLFAHDTASDGLIQCGSYTGNGGATGPVVTLGWEPQWLMIKRSAGGVDDWVMIDSMRGMANGNAASNESVLIANGSNAEVMTNRLSPLATGFQLTDTGAAVNASGSTYVYIAIRRPNKPPTSGTQVFSAGALDRTNNPYVSYTANFPIDLFMEKALTLPQSHWVYDRLRGGSVRLFTDTTDSETTGLEPSYYNYGFDYQDRVVNKKNGGTTSPNYFVRAFRRAPGFFDVVCYTGTGSNTTQTHNLGVMPEVILIKSRSGIRNWNYLTNFGATTYTAAVLNDTYAPGATPAAYDTLMQAQPTSTQFSISTSFGVNNSGETYVAYLFASCPGVSKVGSYTGNGTSQTINCGFTTGTRFILIKRTDSTGDWYVWDSARGIVAANDPHLSLNTTAAEVTTDDSVDPDNSGFIVNQLAATNINVTSATYIYLAIA